MCLQTKSLNEQKTMLYRAITLAVLIIPCKNNVWKQQILKQFT